MANSWSHAYGKNRPEVVPFTWQPTLELGHARHGSIWVEMRTTAGPSRVLQWVLSGGPYTV
jgi:hypothetical protein